MFLPFLLGILHQYGWFNWIKKEWVTLRYWKKRFLGWYSGEQGPQQQGASSAAAKGGSEIPEGAVCTPDGCCYLPEETNAGDGVPGKAPNKEVNKKSPALSNPLAPPLDPFLQYLPAAQPPTPSPPS